MKINLCDNEGYTLIEILVVLFIISIVTTVALLSISHNSNKKLEAFANELTQMMTLAEERAMLQPEILGLLLRDDSYQFASLQSQSANKNITWIPLQDSTLGKHVIPSDIQVDLQVGQSRTAITEDDAKKNDPQIVISTNGDVTPFTIYIGKKGEKSRYVIVGDADGSISNKLLS